MKKWLATFPLLLVSITAFSIPNPASVYCVHHGGRLEMMNEPAGVTGVCVFRDKSYCEVCIYTRRICEPSQFYLHEKRWKIRFFLTQLSNKNLIIYLCKA